MDSYTIAKKIADFGLSKKAHDIKVLDLRKLGSVTDFFVICDAETDVQIRAISEAILGGMKQEGVQVWHREGMQYYNWVLLDYVNVVVHVFRTDLRAFYGLERLWGDAEVETIEDEAE